MVGSAAEAEVAALYHCAQELVPLRQACIQLGYPQPATPMSTDNSTADGIMYGTVKQRRSKAINMRLYWLLEDRESQKMFNVQWAPGKVNLANYYTNHHPAKYYVKKIRSI